jgi:hypothetical protein
MVVAILVCNPGDAAHQLARKGEGMAGVVMPPCSDQRGASPPNSGATAV